jgi:Rrf2 family protein
VISTTSEYALRALSCLARAAEGQALLGKDLALLADVPSNYLAKILLDLKRAGIVTATRGTGGGYQLAKDPEDVPLADVVEVFEGPCCASRCLLGGSRECSDSTACAFHSKWREVRRAYAHFLRTTTLDEVVVKPFDSPTPAALEETAHD